MSGTNNNNSDELQTKFDLKQFSEYQIAISKQELHDEFEKNRRELRKYKISFWTSIITFIVTLAGITGFASFYTWHNIIKDLSKSVNDRLNIEVSRIDTTIQKSLDFNFSTPVIKYLIENKAQEYTEKNARKYIETQVDEKITPFIKSAEYKIKQIDISALEAKAYNDDKDAYDQLRVILHKDNNPEIKKAIDNISQSYIPFADFWKFPDYLPRTSYSINDKLVDQDSIATDVLFTYLNDRLGTYETQMSLMYAISKRPKTDVLKYASKTLNNSKSIQACVSTTHIVMYILKKQGDYMDFDGWIKIINAELK